MLLARVRYRGHFLYARPTAVAALAEIGKGLELRGRERVLEALIDLLRDPHYRIAMAAARGIGCVEHTGSDSGVGGLCAHACVPRRLPWPNV